LRTLAESSKLKMQLPLKDNSGKVHEFTLTALLPVLLLLLLLLPWLRPVLR
jgi:hypothetical protein